ncbi:MAG: class IV adenylate cyclase [Candidatus Shapirobacteria bacterium]
MEEVEVKFLEIDPEEIQKKLLVLGAKKVFDRKFCRRVFDYPDLRLDKQGAWLRVRDEGDQITLTFKQRLGIKSHDGSSNDESMEEIEVIVSDFEKTAEILRKIGLEEKHYIENRRIRYLWRGIEFDLDFWPMIPPLLEIEAKSWKEIEKAIAVLGLDPSKKKIFSAYQVYAIYGVDENKYQIITFDRQVKKK